MRKQLRMVYRALSRRGMDALAEHAQRWPIPDEPAKDMTAADTRWLNDLTEYITSNLATDLQDRGGVKAHVERSLRARAKAVMAEFGMSFDADIYNRIAADYQRVHAYDKGVLVDISATTKDLVGQALKREIEDGHTFAEARNSMGHMFSELEDWETLRIARTEIASSCRYGSLATTQAAVDEFGIVVQRVELSAASDACDLCLQLVADAQAANPPWTIDLAYAKDLHPQCRCDWIYDVADAEE